MVEKGTLVRVDYEAWTEDGELFDTTSKDVAKANGRFNEEIVYEPLPVLVGASRVIPGFDEALLDAKVGEEKDVQIPAEKAFGPKDPSKVDTIPLREFQKQEVNPYPGMRLQHQGRMATVTNVSPGRVRVDYNPPFAGKALRYKFTIRETIEQPDAKIRGFIELAYGQGRAADFEIKVDGETAEIKLPDSCKYDQRWAVAKYRLVSDLRAYANVRTARFIEEYTTEEPKAAATEAPAAGAPGTHTHADGTVHHDH